MARPVTLFTGQWADLPLAELAKKAASWGYDGMELACWGDHFEVDKALEDDGYCKAKREMKEPKEITMKNGRPATQGICPTCGTKMFRIGKSK